MTEITINMNKKTIYEILSEVSAIKKVGDRAAILREVCKQRQGIAKLIQYTYRSDVNFDLPEGDLPDSIKPGSESISTGGLQYHLNRSNWYVMFANSIEPKYKKEMLFQNIYTNTHELDRQVLVGMKDKKLPFRNLNEKFCRKTLPKLFKGDEKE